MLKSINCITVIKILGFWGFGVLGFWGFGAFMVIGEEAQNNVGLLKRYVREGHRDRQSHVHASGHQRNFAAGSWSWS